MNFDNKIGYVTATWNPIVMRCNPVSEGCEGCWHLRMVKRLQANPFINIAERMAYKERRVILRKKELEAPLRRKKPEIIAVQFMGDLFHEKIPLSLFWDVWRTMIECPWHLFLLLTKRPQNMKEIIGQSKIPSHIWLGVTVENPARADERIPILLSIPAAVHFVSVEPMLGKIDLSDYLYFTARERATKTNKLSWVICGEESGPNKRPCKPEWIEFLHSQCKTAGIPFWDKRKQYIKRERL